MCEYNVHSLLDHRAVNCEAGLGLVHLKPEWRLLFLILIVID